MKKIKIKEQQRTVLCLSHTLRQIHSLWLTSLFRAVNPIISVYPSPAKPKQLLPPHSHDLCGCFQNLVSLTEACTNLAETLSRLYSAPHTACRTLPLICKLLLPAKWPTLSQDFDAYSGLGIHLTEQSELLKWLPLKRQINSFKKHGGVLEWAIPEFSYLLSES